MTPNKIKKTLRPAVAVSLALSIAALSGCSAVGALDTKEVYKQGYVIDEQTLQLVPPGSSREQVLLALGTPTTTEDFDTEVFYYISQTRQRNAAFLKTRLVDQRILAVYFDDENTVQRIADYGLRDGRVFDFITRTTPTGGKDQTFLAQVFSGTVNAGPGRILGR